jgi:hypothetical protein
MDQIPFNVDRLQEISSQHTEAVRNPFDDIVQNPFDNSAKSTYQENNSFVSMQRTLHQTIHPPTFHPNGTNNAFQNSHYAVQYSQPLNRNFTSNSVQNSVLLPSQQNCLSTNTIYDHAQDHRNTLNDGNLFIQRIESKHQMSTEASQNHSVTSKFDPYAPIKHPEPSNSYPVPLNEEKDSFPSFSLGTDQFAHSQLAMVPSISTYVSTPECPQNQSDVNNITEGDPFLYEKTAGFEMVPYSQPPTNEVSSDRGSNYVNKYSTILASIAPSDAAPLPKGENILSSGFILSRISFRTILFKKWKQSFWIQYGLHSLLVFRSHSDFDNWLNNPYCTKEQRHFLVKFSVHFVYDLHKPQVRGFQVTQARTKKYGKLYMKHFKLERWMDYGPTIAAAFASTNPNEVDELRRALISCMRNTPLEHGIRATGAVRQQPLQVPPPPRDRSLSMGSSEFGMNIRKCSTLMLTTMIFYIKADFILSFFFSLRAYSWYQYFSCICWRSLGSATSI